MSRKASEKIDYTSRDYEAYRNMMIAQLKDTMREYTDRSQSDAGIVIIECLANGLDICSLYTDVLANDVILPTTQDRATACVLARNLGYVPYNQTASLTPQIFKLSMKRGEDTLIPKGTKVATKAENGVQLVFETVADLTIPAEKTGDETDDNGNYLYTVDVINATSVSDGKIGTSNGTAYQKFNCNYPRVLVDTLKVRVGQGTAKEEWTRVDSFFDTDIENDSKVYTVSVDDFDICYIEFGDNVHGMIPNQDYEIDTEYMIGGGKVGNVNEGTITVLKTSIPYVESTENISASTTLGRDKESLSEIKYNAPAAFRVRDRAVTLKDYEDLIKINSDEFFGIYNTKAIRNEADHLQCDMYFQMREEIIGEGEEQTTYTYPLDEDLKVKLNKFFDDREMIGAHHTFGVYTKDNNLAYKVNLSLRLIVHKDYYAADVEKQVKDYIEKVFFAFGEFTFGDDFVKTDLEAEILNNISGVRSLRIVTPVEDIIMVEEENQIITLGEISISTSGGIV